MTNGKKIRQPAVAGQFYAASPERLSREVRKYLQAVPEPEPDVQRVVGLISPHAGYPCSAPTAAYGYRFLQRFAYKRAVVIAPSHSDYFSGIAVYDGDGYATPLGVVAVDRQLCDKIAAKSPLARAGDIGHRTEHALEVQLPFLQVLYPDGFELVPLTVGMASARELQEFAGQLGELVRYEDTVVIASSDLSHYYPQALAHQKDRRLIELLENYDLPALARGYDDQSLEACGLGPILVLMNYARQFTAAECRILDYRTSGDTCGDKLQVVGYTSAVITV